MLNRNSSLQEIWLADERRLLPKEGLLAIDIAKQLDLEGYIIHSKTAVANWTHSQEYKGICEKTHSFGFDLVAFHDDYIKIGIEIKPHITYSSFQVAIGQCLVGTIKDDVSHAIIFGESIIGKTTRNMIRRVMSKINASANISVRTLKPLETIWEPVQ